MSELTGQLALSMSFTDIYMFRTCYFPPSSRLHVFTWYHTSPRSGLSRAFEFRKLSTANRTSETRRSPDGFVIHSFVFAVSILTLASSLI